MRGRPTRSTLWPSLDFYRRSATLSAESLAESLDDLIRSHLETLEAAPGDTRAFLALEKLYGEHGRVEDLVDLYEARARSGPDPGSVPELLVKAADLARRRLGNPARAEELYRLALGADPRHAEALRAVAELCEE